METTIKQRTRRDLGQANSLAVFREVLFDAPVPRAEIARRTSLTAASVSRITRQLIDAGLVEEFEVHKTGKPGRQLINLRLRSDGGYVVGVSINAFEQRVAVANLQREMLAESALPRESVLDPQTSAATASAAVRSLLKEHRIERRRVFGVGVASAGVVDPKKGIVLRAPTLGWEAVSFGSELEGRLGVPVRMSSIPNAIAAAEHRFGIARDLQDFLVIHATLGIGMCMVVDGHLLSGHRGQAGLVGEMQISSQGDRGARVTVGLDEIAGGSAIVRRWLGHKAPSMVVRSVRQSQLLQLIEAANSGDARANSICDKGARQLGGVVGTIAVSVGSEAVILAGPLNNISTYRRQLESAIKAAMGRERSINILTSERRGIQAACMLAIGELAATGSHLHQLLKR